jgi:serine phosphatase RsbU (regulator of sigma subunit)
MAPTEPVPLHRLLRRREAAALLSEFEDLLPASDLALIQADGRTYAGSTAWNQADLEEFCAQAGGGQAIRTSEAVLKPLLVNTQLAGALVARPGKGPDQERAVERALRCLHASLTLLFTQTLDTREVVGETLDRYREINLLYRIGETIGGCLDVEEIPQRALAEVQRIIPADAGIVVLAAEPVTESPQSSQAMAASFGADEQVRALAKACPKAIERASDKSEPTTIILKCPPEAAGTGMGPILCAPLKTQDVTHGALVLGRLVGQPEFIAGDGKLVMALARQAAIAMETARLHEEEVKRQRLEEELAIGRQIQLSLLPQDCPVVPGWELAATYQPARQVGGDLYDFFQSPDDPHHLSMVIADVTGKGIPAALFMAFSRTVIRGESVRGHNPATALRRANHFIVKDIRQGLFLTAFYATLNTRTGRLAYASGGHDWPLWLRADTGESQRLAARGFVLGAFQDVDLEERAIDMGPGDLLILYTDGVTEARDPNRGLFGEERLEAAVKANANANAQQVLEAIVAAVEVFTAGTPQADDLTLFVLKRQS